MRRWNGPNVLNPVKAVSVLAVFLTFSIPRTASADELPKELLLKCEGKSAQFLNLGTNKADFDERSFDITLRLKNGAIGDIQFNSLDGKDCVLADGEIRCELNSVRFSRETNSTEKRHSTVSIVRTTGELRAVLETWSFEGTRAVGTPSFSLRLIRTGVCRQVSKPIF